MDMTRIGKLINTIVLPGTPEPEILNAAGHLRALFSRHDEAPLDLLLRMQADALTALEPSPSRWRRRYVDVQDKLLAAETERDAVRQQRDAMAEEIGRLRQLLQERQAAAPSSTGTGGSVAYRDFMWQVVRRLGRTRGWSIAYCAATASTAGCTPVRAADIMAWSSTRQVPAWAVEQVEKLDFSAQTEDILWTDGRLRLLAEAVRAEPTISPARLAALCARKIGKPVRAAAIAEALRRARQRGLLDAVARPPAQALTE